MLGSLQIQNVIAENCSICVLKVPEQSAACTVLPPAQLEIIPTNIDLRQPDVAVSRAKLKGRVDATDFHA